MDRTDTWPEEIKSGDMFLDLDSVFALVYVDYGNTWSFLFVGAGVGDRFGLDCSENYSVHDDPVKHNISVEMVYVGNISERFQELARSLLKEHRGYK